MLIGRKLPGGLLGYGLHRPPSWAGPPGQAPPMAGGLLKGLLGLIGCIGSPGGVGYLWGRFRGARNLHMVSCRGFVSHETGRSCHFAPTTYITFKFGALSSLPVVGGLGP